MWGKFISAAAEYFIYVNGFLKSIVKMFSIRMDFVLFNKVLLKRYTNLNMQNKNLKLIIYVQYL